MKDCVLVYLSISLPTQTRTDKRVSAQVEADNEASKGRARVVKKLFSAETLGPVINAAQKVRLTHYRHTLAFDPTGARVLPVTSLIDYEVIIGGVIDEFNRAAAEFGEIYSSVLSTERQRLGHLFDARDYPSHPAKACKARTYYRTVGEVYTMDDAAKDAIAQNVRRSVEEGMATALDDAYMRLADVVGKMVHKLDDTSAIFRNSLLDNVQETADILASLNVFGDARLTQSIDRIRKLGLSPNAARSNAEYRANLANTGRSILDSLKGVLK